MSEYARVWSLGKPQDFGIPSSTGTHLEAGNTHTLAAELLSLEPSMPGRGDLVPGWNQRLTQRLPASQSLLSAADPRPMDQPCDSGSLPGGPVGLGLGP